MEDRIPVRVLCVEFDQPTSPVRIWRMMRRFQRSGYALVHIDGWNCTLVSPTHCDGFLKSEREEENTGRVTSKYSSEF
jgi:hypothetical protein